jgi:hypothetical protein
MSKSYIIATDDMRTGTWNIRTENLKPFESQLKIGFTGEPPVVEFDNLSFGYELRDSSSSMISQGSYPPEGTEYVNTEADESQWMECIKILTNPETDYVLHMWCVNGGNRFEKDFSFTTPRPTQPFASWTWDSSNLEWVSPTPYPDDGKLYDWDEDTTSWVED